MKEFLTMISVFGLDGISKKWAERTLPLHQKRAIVKNRLYFWHIKNSGVAYNKFSGKQNGILLFTGAMIVGYAVVLWEAIRRKYNKHFTLPLALILGGALGNFRERAAKGRVTDFLYIPVKGKNAPVFNLADAAIWCGAVWHLIGYFVENEKK